MDGKADVRDVMQLVKMLDDEQFKKLAAGDHRRDEGEGPDPASTRDFR